MIDWSKTLVTLLDMLEKACVMAVLAYFMVRTVYFSNLLAKTTTYRQHLLLIAAFTGFSLYGALNGLQVNGSVVALIHSGAILAGLFGGIRLGTGVGLITALIRYTLGGPYAMTSTIATFLAGFTAGALNHLRHGRPVSASAAAGFTAVFEVLIRFIPVILSPNHGAAAVAQIQVLIPMLLGNVTMVFIFTYVVITLREEKQNRVVRARLETELHMAREIQLSLVPHQFSPFPGHPGLEVFAILAPAREVGGDMYDFFFLDDRRICFGIADVSGKGMPAALFMAATRTLFKAQADRDTSIGEVVARINQELCRGNDSSQFVTFFCGILDTHSGELTYCNAGHNPPYIRRAAGSLEILADRHGPAAGIIPDIPYSSSQTCLQPGDLLLLYTDGVTEAENQNQQMYSQARIEQLLASHMTKGPHEFLPLVMRSVKDFADGAEQSDDITLLGLARSH